MGLRQEVMMKMQSKPSRCQRATGTGAFQKPYNYNTATAYPEKGKDRNGGEEVKALPL